MTVSTSHLAYGDAYDVMDRALEDPTGVRVRMKDLGAATFFRMRCHQARAIDRKRSMALYEKDEPMYNASVYDKLVLRIRQGDDKVYVYVQQIETAYDIVEVEALSDVVQLDQLEAPPPQEQIMAPQPMLQIEHIKRRV